MARKRKVPAFWAIPALLVSAAIGAHNFPAPPASVAHTGNPAVKALDHASAAQAGTTQPGDRSDMKLAAMDRSDIAANAGLSAMAHNVDDTANASVAKQD